MPETKARKVPNLLRSNQVANLQDDKAYLQKLIDHPQSRDRSGAVRQLQRLEKQMETQVPRPFEGRTLDAAVSRANDLIADITTDMPTRDEMMKNPTGSVGKHLAWERRNKDKILEWKYLRLRINAGTDDPDVANIEQYRPQSRTGELNMESATIGGHNRFHMPLQPGTPVVFSVEEMTKLREVAPDLAAKFIVLDAEQRQEVKDAVMTLLDEGPAPEKPYDEILIAPAPAPVVPEAPMQFKRAKK